MKLVRIRTFWCRGSNLSRNDCKKVEEHILRNKEQGQQSGVDRCYVGSTVYKYRRREFGLVHMFPSFVSLGFLLAGNVYE